MNKIFVITDGEMLLHKPKYFHVERPDRLQSLLNLFKDDAELKNEITLISPEKASEENILLVHSQKHIDHIRESILNDKDVLDEGDTYACASSIDAALLAAGSTIKAVDEIFQNKRGRIFCAVRPPGHHAESNRVMGFCLFNNVAVAAAYAIKKYSLQRVAIVDWDVHHGNGTQEIFYHRSDVLFISLHQHPLYPGSGMYNETGKGEGENFTMNFPLPAISGIEEYENIFRNEILPALQNYKPQLLLISAGFDAHKNDPIANMNLDENDFGKLTSILSKLCKTNSTPIISVLEGGYDLPALRNSVKQHLIALMS